MVLSEKDRLTQRLEAAEAGVLVSLATGRPDDAGKLMVITENIRRDVESLCAEHCVPDACKFGQSEKCGMWHDPKMQGSLAGPNVAKVMTPKERAASNLDEAIRRIAQAEVLYDSALLILGQGTSEPRDQIVLGLRGAATRLRFVKKDHCDIETQAVAGQAFSADERRARGEVSDELALILDPSGKTAQPLEASLREIRRIVTEYRAVLCLGRPKKDA